MERLKFTQRPSPVLPEHRPLYKITQTLLVLYFSRGKKSSILRLHLFNWAINSPKRMNILSDAAKTGMLKLPTWGFDPALAAALRFALAEKLVVQISNGYQLGAQGLEFLKLVMSDKEVFAEERSELSKIGLRITETMVERVATDWN